MSNLTSRMYALEAQALIRGNYKIFHAYINENTYFASLGANGGDLGVLTIKVKRGRFTSAKDAVSVVYARGLDCVDITCVTALKAILPAARDACRTREIKRLNNNEQKFNEISQQYVTELEKSHATR